jgi:hypothetical protein
MLRESPQASEERVNNASPAMKSAGFPVLSESLPKTSRSAVRIRRYAVMVHWETDTVVWKAVVMVGSAILTTIPSMTDMSTAVSTTASTAYRRGDALDIESPCLRDARGYPEVSSRSSAAAKINIFSFVMFKHRTVETRSEGSSGLDGTLSSFSPSI